MNYIEALEYIHGAGRLTVPPGLERVRRLCELLGHPERSLRFVHITGTNGKGSVASMLDHILSAAGYRTGLFTSPYLEDFRERIRLGGHLIPRETLAGLTTELAPLIDRIISEGFLRPNEFETVTVLALMYYARSNCDLVIWEVGLGGAVDATNVIPAPEAAVLTPISTDHTALLGTSPEEIAREKSGIIKPGTGAVITAIQTPAVLQILRDRCAGAGVPLLTGSEPEQVRLTGDGCTFRCRGMDIRLPLLGAHQPGNACCAIAAAIALRERRGWNIPDISIAIGLAAVKWPGRMEVLSRKPLVIVDCAHNRAAVDALMNTVEELYPRRPITALVGMMADKEYGYCLSRIAAASRRVYCVSVGLPRALTPMAAAEVCRPHCSHCVAAGTVEQGLDLALKQLPEEDLLLVCGSVYVAGAARRHLLTEK